MLTVFLLAAAVSAQNTVTPDPFSPEYRLVLEKDRAAGSPTVPIDVIQRLMVAGHVVCHDIPTSLRWERSVGLSLDEALVMDFICASRLDGGLAALKEGRARP